MNSWRAPALFRAGHPHVGSRLADPRRAAEARFTKTRIVPIMPGELFHPASLEMHRI